MVTPKVDQKGSSSVHRLDDQLAELKVNQLVELLVVRTAAQVDKRLENQMVSMWVAHWVHEMASLRV